MKNIDKKDLPEVSGGFAPDDDCFPLPPYPTSPVGPIVPMPMPTPVPLPGTDTDQFTSV